MISSERLRFRRLRPDDIDHLYALDGDPEVMRYLDDGKARTRQYMADVVVPEFLAERWPSGEVGRWAAERTSDDAFVGRFSLRPVVPSDEPMDFWGEADSVAVLALGYRLRRAVWGQGLASEGARVLVDHAFTVPGVEQVVATTMAVNAGSRRVMEKAGLWHRQTRVVDWPAPLRGYEQGDVEYAVTRSEWAHARHRGLHDAHRESAR